MFGFFGLDVLLLYWAFRLNYRHAEAYEQVTVTSSALTVRKVSHLGRAREWVLNPLWVRLDKVEHEEFGIERLFLVSRGRKLSIATLPRPRRKGKLCQGTRKRAQRSPARANQNRVRIARNRVVGAPRNRPR